MSENTKIEWCDSTFNPFIGCTKVSPGCDNCYAEKLMDHRMHKVQWGVGQARVRTSEANWKKPLAWNANHEAFFAEHGRRQRVFCASLADVFDNEVDPAWRRDLFSLIELTPNLDWLLLTKRIGNVRDMVPLPWISKPFQHGPDPKNIYTAGWPANVWLGITVVNQEEADRDIPKLLQTTAAVRFLSIEPMLGPINLSTGSGAKALPLYWEGAEVNGLLPAYCGHTGRRLNDFTRRGWVKTSENMSSWVDWIIAGGESGPNARPAHPDWFRSLRDQCVAAGVPFLFKQWGEWLPWTQFNDAGVEDSPEQTRFKTAELEDGNWRDVGRPQWCDSADGVIDDEHCVGRVGKKAAGRILDGRTWDEFPSASVKP